MRLATGEVVLRPWQVDDVPAHVELVRGSYEHLRPWMPWVTADYKDADSLRYITQHTSDRLFALEVGGRLAGSVGLHERLGPGALEMGYWIGVDFAGQGHMTATAGLLTAHAFDDLGLSRVEIHHDRANGPSGRIPARLGYRRVAVVEKDVAAPGECGEEWQWAMDAADWAARIVPGQAG